MAIKLSLCLLGAMGAVYYQASRSVMGFQMVACIYIALAKVSPRSDF